MPFDRNRLILKEEDLALCGIILTEILQGIGDYTAHRRVRRYLSPLTMLPMPEAVFVYVYAVTLHSGGKPKDAIMVLQGAHNAHPNDQDILAALVAFHRDGGNEAAARGYAEKPRAISP